MENAIHWSQTLNTYWCLIAFVAALVFVLSMIISDRPGKQNTPWDKVIIIGFVLFALPQSVFFARAYVDASKGTQYKADLMNWRQEADALPGLALRPEMTEMLIYLENNIDGGVAALKGIKDALDHDLMTDNYLSFVEYGQFQAFLNQCYTGPSATSFEATFSDRYPVSQGDVKGYLKALMGQDQLEQTCRLAVPLITLR